MQAVMASEGLDVAAFDFILDADGTTLLYDININTNYNSDAEARAGVSVMALFAEHLAAKLAAVSERGLKAAS